MTTKQYPMRGVSVWTNQFNQTIFRLHYTADSSKDENWVARERAKCTSEDLWQQEMEINFHATEGSLLYHLSDEASLLKSFPIPHDWTRVFALDTHPVKPHAALWGAVSPHGDLYIYRELWPSKIYNKPGSVPDADNRISIRDYCRTLQWLESKENPYNEGKDEHIYDRVIDYSARAFGKGTSDDDESMNFQERFEMTMSDIGMKCCHFTDAKKDKKAGEAEVNEWLRPRLVQDPGADKFVSMSRMRIFHDQCPELIWQLKNNRRKPMTMLEQQNKDPELRRIEKRNDLTDCLKYMVTYKPEYVERSGHAYESTLKHQYSGISY